MTLSEERRFKSYPLVGANDEYFHNGSNQLLSDRGVDSLAMVGSHPEDDYIWLDGRPVAVVRGKFDLAWNRLSDSTSNCGRNDEAAKCGLYFVVADHIGKPVLVLDSSRRVAGAADYEPFGHVNRVAVDKETPHPYLGFNGTVAILTQPQWTGVNLRMRVLFHLVDVQDSPNDYAQLLDGPGGPQLGGQVRGYHRGQIWSPWVQPTGQPTGSLVVSFVSGADSCCPVNGGIDCTCPQRPIPSSGANVKSSF